MSQNQTISFEEFSRLDLRVGTILACEEVENSYKLYKLTVDLGVLGKREILSGIKKDFSPEELIGTQVLVAANLEPKQMAGLVSEGMILMAVDEDKVTLLVPQKKVKEGTKVE